MRVMTIKQLTQKDGVSTEQDESRGMIINE